MRAAAGLQVDAGDLEQADAALARRRLHRHGAHQLGLGGELRIGDPLGLDRMVLGNEGVDLGFDLILVERAVGQIEVEPSLAVADLPAGDAAGHHRRHQMQARMHAHVTIAPRPVDGRLDLGTDLRRRLSGCRDMHDLTRLGALAGIGDGDGAAIGKRQGSGIARLAAARGIEDGAVEVDAGGVHLGHRRLAVLEIGIGAEQFLGHRRIPGWRVDRL